MNKKKRKDKQKQKEEKIKYLFKEEKIEKRDEQK